MKIGKIVLIIIMIIIFIAGLGYLAYYWFYGRNAPGVESVPVTEGPIEHLTGDELFVSNFDSEEDLSKWEIFDDDGAQEEPSHWFFEDGVLKQDSNIWGGSFGIPVKNKSYLGSQIVTKDGADWQNYYVHLRLKPLDNDGVGFLVRYQNKNNYLRIFIIQDKTQDNGGPFIKIDKRVKGKTIGLYVKKFTYNVGQWNDVNILVKGKRTTFWFGEEKTKSNSIWATDGTFKKGRFGFSVYAEEGVEFDDVVIEKR